jgi:hypothetical protein
MADIRPTAESGFLPAIKDLAQNYRGGWNGLEQNLETARSWAEKVKAAGDTEWADPFLASLDTLEARATQQVALAGKVNDLSSSTFDFLKELQDNSANYPNMAATLFPSLFLKIWYDANFTVAEEDLVTELVQQQSITVTSESGETLNYTRVPAAGDHAAFIQTFPTPFPASNPNYPLNYWGTAVTGGPSLYFIKESGVQDQARDAFLRALYQQLNNLVTQAQQTNNNYNLTQFNNDLVSRAKAMEPTKGREFAGMVYAMIRDDIQATSALLNIFSSLNTFAQSPLPEPNS